MKRPFSSLLTSGLPAAVAAMTLLSSLSQAANGVITSGPLTGDADSGLATSKTYIARANVIGADVTVNSVTLIGSGAGTSGTGWSLGGIGSQFGSGGNHTTTFGASTIDNLFDGFQYGGNPGVVNFTGLTAGQTYVGTLYSEAWTLPDNRTQTVIGSAGGSLTYNQDAIEASMLRYTFVATGASHSLTLTPQNSGFSFHVYGLTNEQVFNNAWSAGSTWAGSTFSGGVPNGVGSNASFPSGAIGSPTTISVDAPITLGHLQLDGAQAYTIGGASTVSLQTDVGGTSALTVPSGTHTVSAPISMVSPVAKFGSGTLVLSGALSGSGNGITVGGGTLQLASATGNLTGLGPITVDGATVQFNNGSAQTYGGIISGSGTLTKSGAGVLNLTGTASTYTGESIINGTVNVASLSDYSVAGSLGARTLAQENNSTTGVGIHIVGGTIQYTGATPQSTDRHVRIHTSGATFDASGTGSGTMSFTRSGANMNLFDTGGARTVTLTGTNTGLNTFNITLQDQGTSPTHLVKNNTGTWVYGGSADGTVLGGSSDGNNRGNITVNGGTLIMTGRNDGRLADATGKVTVNSGGTLQLQANPANTISGISYAMSREQTANQPLVINGGGNLRLRGDSDVTFAGGNNFGGLGGATIGIDVNQVTGGNNNRTLTLAPAGFATGNTTINVTGGNGYTLQTGPINNANGAALTLNANSAHVAINGGIANVSTLNLGGAMNSSVSGVVSGAATITKAGAGTATLGGVNTYTGGLTVQNGTLNLSGARTATHAAITVGNVSGQTGTLNLSAGALAMNNTLAVGSGDSTVAGFVNQTGGDLTLAGSKLLVGNGTAKGTYTLSAGTLRGTGVGNRGVILGVNTGSQGTFNLSGTGVLDLTGGNLQVARSENTGAAGAAGAFNQSGGTATVGTLGVGGINATTEAGNIGGLNFTGGTFTATTINAFGGGNNSVAAMNIGGTSVVTLPAFPTTRGTGANTTLVFDGGTLRAGGSSATYLENMTTAQITNNDMKFDINSQTVTINQPLSNFSGHTGGLTVSSALNAGTLTLGGATGNTFTGGLTVNDGTVVLGKTSGFAVGGGAVNIGNGNGSDVLRIGANNQQFPTTTVLNMTSGNVGGTSAKFELNGYTQTIAGLNLLAGSVSVIQNTESGAGAGPGPGTLVINNPSAVSYNNYLRNGGSTLALTKEGAGLLTLGGGNITYNGTTTVNAGVLRLTDTVSYQSPTVINSTLELNRSVAGAMSINPTLSGPGNVHVMGPGTTIIAGNNSYEGGTTSSGATRLRAGHASAYGIGTVNLSAGDYSMLWWNTGSNTMANPWVLNGLGGTRDGELKTTIYADGGGAGFTNYILTGPVTLNATSDVGGYGTLGFSNTLRLEGPISGAGGLTKGGLNDTYLQGTDANSYAGVTTLKEGVLHLAKTAGVNAVPGNLVVGDSLVNGTIHHGDIVRLEASDQIADTGIITVNGAASGQSGKFELNGFDETVAGINSTHNFSVIQILESALGSQSSTLTVNNTTSQNFAGILRNSQSGAGTLALTKGGTGTLTLSGSAGNGYTGMTTVNAGTLELAKAGGNLAVSGSLTIGDGSGTDTVLWSANNMVADNAVVTFNAGGIAQLNGRLETIGALQSTGGAGVFNNGSAGSADLTLGGTLVAPNNASGSFSGTITQSGGGAINLVKNGSGTQVFTAGHSYTGKTTINGGVLEIASGLESSLGLPSPAADALTLNGGTLAVSTANLTLNDAGRNILVGLGGGTLDVAASRNLTIANTVDATGTSLTKSGTGSLNLTGTTLATTMNLQGGVTDISGGSLRVDNLDLAGGTFVWGTGRLNVRTSVAQNGTQDYTDPGYTDVRGGQSLAINGNATTTSGSVLQLHSSPSFYINNGVRFNSLDVAGTLNLTASGDSLEVEISPFFLRPFSPSLGKGAEDFGSIPLVSAGQILGTFDLFGQIYDDGLGFTAFTGTFSEAASLPMNTYYIEYADTNADLAKDTLFFHYRVNGYVPEPATFSLMGGGALLLRHLRRRGLAGLFPFSSTASDTPGPRQRRRRKLNDKPLHVLKAPESSERF